VSPADTDQIHPIKVWLVNQGYTQTWLGIKLRPQKPIDQRHIYLWFSRRAKPRRATIEKMSALTRGKVTIAEIEEFYSSKQILKSRRMRSGGKNAKQTGKRSRAKRNDEATTH